MGDTAERTRVALTTRTRVLGVIGCPVVHSLSPAMQNAALQALGLDYIYCAFDVEPEFIAEAIDGVRALGVAGLNVTIPHKRSVYELVDEQDESARRVQAVNTIQNRDGNLVGYNTDGEGFIRALREANYSPEGKRVTLIGAGGAARSVAASCLRAGASEINILARRPDQSSELASGLKGAGASPVVAGALADGREIVRSSDLLVQCTPVGMHPHEDDAPPVPRDWLRPDMLVFDLIYNPAETKLLAAARSVGARTLNGVGMLVHQGAAALEIWTGVPAPVEVMRVALLAALMERSR